MMLFYDTKFRFTVEQLQIMFKLQAAANDAMSDAWRTSCNCTIPYYRASWMEGSEAVDHIGHKWWKKFTPNIDLMKGELIDIFHFTLSHIVRDSYVAFAEDGVPADDDTVFEHAAEIANDFERTISILPVGRNYSEDAYEKIAVDAQGLVDIEKYDFKDLMELFIYTCLAEGRPDLTILYALFDNVGMDVKTVYTGYIAKNYLNLFRTANGQREHNYYKVWDGREDNAWLDDFIASEKAACNEITVESLHEYLTATYEMILQEGKGEKK